LKNIGALTIIVVAWFCKRFFCTAILVSTESFDVSLVAFALLVIAPSFSRPRHFFSFSLCFVSGIVGISANALVVRPSLLNSFAL